MQFEDDRDILILVLADMLWQNGMLTDEIKKEAVKKSTVKESTVEENTVKNECFIKLKAALTPTV